MRQCPTEQLCMRSWWNPEGCGPGTSCFLSMFRPALESRSSFLPQNWRDALVHLLSMTYSWTRCHPLTSLSSAMYYLCSGTKEPPWVIRDLRQLMKFGSLEVIFAWEENLAEFFSTKYPFWWVHHRSLTMRCVRLNYVSVPECPFTVWTSANKSVAQQPTIAGSLNLWHLAKLKWFSPGGTLKWTLKGRSSAQWPPFGLTQTQRGSR